MSNKSIHNRLTISRLPTCGRMQEETAAIIEGEEMTKEETQRACMRIGDNIDRYLKRAGMTQRMLAAYADMTEVSISRYISGERTPRVLALYKISKALNCTMEDLMYGVFD